MMVQNARLDFPGRTGKPPRLERPIFMNDLLKALLSLVLLVSACSAAIAEELWVIRDGVLNKDALTPAATEVTKDHVGCGGETVAGLYVSTPRALGRPNWARFTTARSALGDCEYPEGGTGHPFHVCQVFDDSGCAVC